MTKDKSKDTAIKLLQSLRAGHSRAALTPEQVIAANDAFQRIKGFHRDLLRCRYGDGRGISEIAAMMGRPEPSVVVWHTLALAEYRAKLMKAGLLTEETRKPKTNEEKTGRRPKPKVRASIPCPQCKAMVQLPVRRDAKTSCPGCSCHFHVIRDKTRGVQVEILNPENITRPAREIPLTINQCYELLEVSPVDPLPVIRKAYLTQIQQYHPDKVHHLGPKLREVAESMAKKLNYAWALIQSAPVT